MSHEKNAEIWSTRLQKELLALTTDNASEKETQEVAGILPPFILFKSHQLDIAEGIAKVAFLINVQTTPPDTDTEDDQTQSEDDIILVIDASLPLKSDGSDTIDTNAAAYPFTKPAVLLQQGAERFPKGSTIQNGSFVDIDCDWTPSLHLTDAVLNIGLKVKESLLQDEPFHAAANAKEQKSDFDHLFKSARRFGSFLGKSVKNLSVEKQPKTSPAVSLLSRRKKAKEQKKKATAKDINIGDEIHLLEPPWVDCQGLYSCKAIRRPAFIEDAIILAAAAAQAKAQETPQQQVNSEAGDDDDVPDDFGNFVKLQTGAMSKVAGAGFAGAGAMFRSFTASAKSVIEESFLMITETHIIELRSSKLNLSTGTVTFAISIELMAKLKFRRQESISLFFKPAPDDPLIFMCPDSAAAVQQIQSVLKAHGVKGKHTNATTHKAIQEALVLVQEIQAKERALEYQPSAERVSEIMDLYRQAAERFEVAGDARHEEVVTHMRKFLDMPLTVSILDGSYKPEEPKEEKKPDGPVPEGEVLERTQEQLEADDDDFVAKADEKDDADFEKNIDSVLEEAKKDLEKINDGLDDGNLDVVDGDLDIDGDGDLDGDGDNDGFDDLDAMLAAADAELADMMAS